MFRIVPSWNGCAPLILHCRFLLILFLVVVVVSELDFPTHVYSTHQTLADATAEKQQHFNIGVIQVRLKHWTTTSATPITTTTTARSVTVEVFHSPFVRYPPQPFHAQSATGLVLHNNASTNGADRTLFAFRGTYHHNHYNRTYHQPYDRHRTHHSGYRTSTTLSAAEEARLQRRKNRKNSTSTTVSPKMATTTTIRSALGVDGGFLETIRALWRRADPFNNGGPLGYMLVAVSFMLVTILAIIYTLLTITLSRDRRRSMVREKYDSMRLVVADTDPALGYGNGDGRRPRYYQPSSVRYSPSGAPNLPPRSYPSRYSPTSSSGRRVPYNPHHHAQMILQNSPKHSFTSQHSASLHRPYGPPSSGRPSEMEFERLYRSISPFRGPPSMTSDESSSTLMRRIGIRGSGGRRMRDRRLRPPLEAPPPPPPPRIPPPPIPPHCEYPPETGGASDDEDRRR